MRWRDANGMFDATEILITKFFQAMCLQWKPDRFIFHWRTAQYDIAWKMKQP
jgi:hypothetical protein